MLKLFNGNYLKSELKRFEGKFTTTFYCTDQHEKTLKNGERVELGNTFSK